jgi:hypothetical protein
MFAIRVLLHPRSQARRSQSLMPRQRSRAERPSLTCWARAGSGMLRYRARRNRPDLPPGSFHRNSAIPYATWSTRPAPYLSTRWGLTVTGAPGCRRYRSTVC